MIQISVVMPLYNASRYLEETLQSVLKQTFKDFELICINDASSDNTIDILYSYAEKDNRISILINEEHMGAAYSRNRGIKEAAGDYIIFLDGDDLFDEDLLQLSYQEIKRTNADIVMYETQHVPTEHIYDKKLSIEHSRKFLEKYCISPFTPRQCEPLDFLNWSVATWSRLYNRKFICSNHLLFQSLSCCNDVYFGYMTLMLADKAIMLSDRRVMVYLRDHSEASRISYDRDPMCGYLAMDKLGKELEKRGLFEQLYQHYYCALCSMLHVALNRAKTEEKAERFYYFLKNEGIKNLTSLYKRKNLILDNYIFNFLRKYEELDFESEWYKNVNMLICHLEIKCKNVIELIGNYHDRGLKIALWGAGINGKTFLHFLECHHIRIAAVIDRDENKWGKEIGGYKIKQPEKAIDEVQVVITTSNNIYFEICKGLDKSGIEIININDILERYL